MPISDTINWKDLDNAQRKWMMQQTVNLLAAKDQESQREGKELLGSISNVYSRRWVLSRVCGKHALEATTNGQKMASFAHKLEAFWLGGLKALKKPEHIDPRQLS